MVVLKVHGAIDRRNPDNDSYVIAEDDYIDYASGREIATLVPATLLKRLRGNHLLFLGYSPRLWSLRVFFRRIWHEPRFDQYSAWAIGQIGDALDERFWLRRGVDVLDVSLESFVAQLEAGHTETTWHSSRHSGRASRRSHGHAGPGRPGRG